MRVEPWRRLWSHSVMSNFFRPYELQLARIPCTSPTPRACSNSCLSSWWCYLTISSSATLFFYLRSFLASLGLFQMRQLFASGSQSIGASASVIPMNIHGWVLLGLTSLISLKSKGFSRVFSSTTVWKHPFFGAQPSIWSNYYICTWLLEKP